MIPAELAEIEALPPRNPDVAEDYIAKLAAEVRADKAAMRVITDLLADIARADSKVGFLGPYGSVVVEMRDELGRRVEGWK